MYRRVKTSESNKTQTIFQNGDVYVVITFIPYDYKVSTIVYFVSNENGDEYGQYSNASEAIDKANQVVEAIAQQNAQKEAQEGHAFKVDETYLCNRR